MHVLRSLDDAAALRAELDDRPAARVIVVGAGFIGAEVAATARTVTVATDLATIRKVEVPDWFRDAVAALA